MLNFVLDTSLFTWTEDSGKVKKQVEDLIDSIMKARIFSEIYCYMPNSVFRELSQALERRKIDKKTTEELEIWLVKMDPDRNKLVLPASILHEYIGDVRDRINKGLRKAEAAVLKSAGKNDEGECGLIIKELRDDYREAIRKGILDSTEDLDVLLLAKELDAVVVANDNGMEKWGYKMGIRFVHGNIFKRILHEYLKKGGEKSGKKKKKSGRKKTRKGSKKDSSR